MQPAENWHRDDFAIVEKLDRPRHRTIPIDPKMRARLVVVRDVLVEHSRQMASVEDDDMV